MSLITQSQLRNKAQVASGFVYESNIRNFSATVLTNEKNAASDTAKFDIFLSHSLEDAILIKGLRDLFAEKNFSVYVDWIEDPQLDRASVSKLTAGLLRDRMRQCKCLFFATSDSAKKSVWMPWELGYMDAYASSRIAIAPIVPDEQRCHEFKGQEYLGLYPYLDLTNGTFYIHESANVWVGFRDWLNGENPARH